MWAFEILEASKRTVCLYLALSKRLSYNHLGFQTPKPFVLKLEIKNGRVYKNATNSTRTTNSYTYLILETLIMLLRLKIAAMMLFDMIISIHQPLLNFEIFTSDVLGT